MIKDQNTPETKSIRISIAKVWNLDINHVVIVENYGTFIDFGVRHSDDDPAASYWSAKLIKNGKRIIAKSIRYAC